MLQTKNNLSDDDIVNSARNVLCDLHDLQTALSGIKPTLEEFFPVNLKQIVEDVLGWVIEPRSEIGYLPTGHAIIGQTNYQEQRILLDVGTTSEGERNFTLAHEIGHIILHKVNYSCEGFASRVHSNRRHDRLLNPDPNRSRLEREAQTFAAELLMPRKSLSLRFQSVFGRERLWIDSTRAKEIMEQSNNRLRSPQLNDLAKAVASYIEVDTGRSLNEFFAVSADAMAVRLMRLKLVY